MSRSMGRGPNRTPPSARPSRLSVRFRRSRSFKGHAPTLSSSTRTITAALRNAGWSVTYAGAVSYRHECVRGTTPLARSARSASRNKPTRSPWLLPSAMTAVGARAGRERARVASADALVANAAWTPRAGRAGPTVGSGDHRRCAAAAVDIGRRAPGRPIRSPRASRPTRGAASAPDATDGATRARRVERNARAMDDMCAFECVVVSREK